MPMVRRFVSLVCALLLPPTDDHFNLMDRTDFSRRLCLQLMTRNYVDVCERVERYIYIH